MQQVGLKAQLRASTHAVHQMLHEAPDFTGLADGTITNRRFQAVMSRMGEFLAALDVIMIPGCHQFAQPLAGYQYHPRGPYFERLGPNRPILPIPACAASLAGMAYVTDGATLGGSLLERASALARTHPYFEFCASRGPAIWRETNALLTRVDQGPEERSRATKAALATFDAFASHVTPAIEEATV